MNFATLKGLTIPEGVVTQITDASGRVLWVLGGKIVLEVEKITSNTYAGETTYENEQFILLDIYPKTNGTVSVTYGGLTKTITDTSGAAEPNAQQVFFGTFNGVSDSVETPASGELTIEGNCLGFACASYAKTSKDLALPRCFCITAVNSFGGVELIPSYAFGNLGTGCSDLKSVAIGKRVKTIGDYAFSGCTGLTSVEIDATSIGTKVFESCTSITSVVILPNVASIGANPWSEVVGNNVITVDASNEKYKIDGNCLIEIATNRLVTGFSNSTIPSYVTWIGEYAFYYRELTSITIPSSVTLIDKFAFDHISDLHVTMLSTTPPTLGSTAFSYSSDIKMPTIIVPKGCGDTYKAAEGWSTYANYIVEAS